MTVYAEHEDLNQYRQFSKEAEQAVLGGLILDGEAWYRISDAITDNDFGIAAHKAVFRAINDMAANDDRIDLITLAERMEVDGTLQEVGGLDYIGLMARDCPAVANIEAYANIVRNLSLKRQLISKLTESQRKAVTTDDATKAISDTAAAIQELSNSGQTSGLKLISGYLPNVIEQLQMRLESDSELLGYSTGLIDVDSAWDGLCGGRLYTIGARPGMGKSALALQMALNIASKSNLPAAFFSLEMQGAEITHRAVSNLQQVPLNAAQKADMDDSQWASFTAGTALLNDIPLYIDDSDRLHYHDIEARARRIYRQNGLGLVVVDYMQLVDGDGDSRVQQVGSVSRNLKRLAMSLKIPVLALAQLNRSLEQRNDKRPQLSDLRECGEIEQDSDVVAFLYREEIYNSDTNEKGIAELLTRKHRNGVPGGVGLLFKGEYSRFYDLAGGIPEYSQSAKSNFAGRFGG